MISKEKMDFAVNQIVNNCIVAKRGEVACIVTDRESQHIGSAISDGMKKVGAEPHLFIMEDFGPRPDDGSNPLKFPDEIKKVLEGSDISVYAAQVKSGELSTFRHPMTDVVAKAKHIRQAHMPGISDLIMETGMQVDYNKVAETTFGVYRIATKASNIRVTTALGSDFTATFSPDRKWITDEGKMKPGQFMNLPAGEVFSTPLSVDGKAIIDGVFGDYMMQKFGLVESTPTEITLKNGRVVAFKSNNRSIAEELGQYLKKAENSDRVGEFGIGTNTGLIRLIGNLLQDEKFPGIHIALGHPFPNMTGADWDSPVHLDMVIQKTTIEVDGKMIMREGKFLI